MAITVNRDTDGTRVIAGGHVLACFTPETSKAAIDRFIALANENDLELTELGQEYELKREWNHTHKRQGKDWPVFNRLDRIVSRLCKQAGIRDS